MGKRNLRKPARREGKTLKGEGTRTAQRANLIEAGYGKGE
jgi:hypothetical protein